MGECQELQIMLAEDSVDLYIISFLEEIKMHLVKLGTPWKSGLYRCTDFKLMHEVRNTNYSTGQRPIYVKSRIVTS